MASVFLDHVVILLPHKDVVNPPKWLTDYFTITPGGRHAGSQTENKLIIFQDGSYIELIAFVDDDPKHRAGHRWGNKKVGIIDFALISKYDAECHYESLKNKLEKGNSSVKYESPIPGGRTRDDGEVLKWQITSPEPPTERGEAPFFCHDVALRELRVPFSSESTSHPSGAYGVAGLNIYVPQEKVSELSTAYEAIVEIKNGSDDQKVGIFEVGSLHRMEGKESTLLNIQEPAEEWQKKLVAERGVLLGDFRIGVITPSGESGQTTRVDWEYDAGGISFQ